MMKLLEASFEELKRSRNGAWCIAQNTVKEFSESGLPIARVDSTKKGASTSLSNAIKRMKMEGTIKATQCGGKIYLVRIQEYDKYLKGN